MNNILSKICEKKKIQLEESKRRCSIDSLKKIIKEKKNRGFKNLLVNSQKKSKNNLIAEIKKESPSAGIIIKDYFPENIALNYEKSGVGAISILTETYFFKGHLEHLSLVNKKINLPIIRKDFIIDSYQILESKVFKADAILLIVSILNDNQIKEFINIADNCGLDCLIETHNEEELNRAINIGYPIIGINNRNLKNLKIDINNTLNLIKGIPREFTVVAESGIKNRDDINKYNDVGVFNFLIGELEISNYDMLYTFAPLQVQWHIEVLEKYKICLKKIRLISSDGIDESDWITDKKMDLKHPCVGLLQRAQVWGKAEEMLILTKILEEFPNVTFYWAGDGPYRDKLLEKLKKYDNFEWLGYLEYPDKVREYLASIDVYLLLSGLDTSPHTVLEAGLMKKPIVATSIGGVSNIIINGKTGFIVEKGNYKEYIEKISILINDEKIRKEMGIGEYEFVKNNFTWKQIAKEFVSVIPERMFS